MKWERGTSLFLIFVILIVIVAQGSECVLEDPPVDGHAEVASVEVGGAGMNSLQDTGLDNVEGGIGKTGVGPRVRICVGVGAGDRKRYRVRTEIECEHLHNAADEGISTRGMVGIIRRVDERLPVSIADRPGIAIEVALSD